MADAAATSVETKKKSKTGLIVALVVVIFMLIGGGVAFFVWMLSHESPENILNDSITKLLTAEDIQATGALSAENKSGKY